MKKWEKEILQKQIQNEGTVSLELEAYYKEALAEVNNKIQILMSKEQTQSVIYQLKYQQELEKQLSEIYGKMSSNFYQTMDDYLTNCYEDSFYTTMYGLHQEGIPVVMPFDQKEAWQMAAQSEYTGIKLSEKLYTSNFEVARKARQEITKGIAMNSSYADITRRVAAKSEASINQAYRITRTEGHRIQNEVKFQTINKVKDETGADIVKQWDSTIDKRTRPDHVALDGQLRELDQPFKIPGKGYTAMFPGGFGIAGEDINCRCVCLQRARWALDKSELDKYIGDLDGATDEQLEEWAQKLGVSKAELIKGSNGVIESDGSINHTIKAQNYNQFKKKYQTKAKTQTKQLESQLDIAQKEYDAILSKYKDKTDFLINGSIDELAKVKNLEKQIGGLQNQLGIEQKTATKTIENKLSKATPAPNDWESLKKNAKSFDSDYAADNYYRSISPDKSNFSEKQLKAMRDYTNESSGDYRTKTSNISYYQMNGALRDKNVANATKAVQEDIKHCTDGIKKCILPEDVKVDRGLRGGLDQFINQMCKEWDSIPDKSVWSDKAFQQSLIGRRVGDLGYMSSAVSGGGYNGLKLEIYLPKGTQAAYVAPFSHFGTEMELLLQQGSYFEIMDVKADSRGYIQTFVLKLVEQKPKSY